MYAPLTPFNVRMQIQINNVDNVASFIVVFYHMFLLPKGVFSAFPKIQTTIPLIFKLFKW